MKWARTAVAGHGRHEFIRTTLRLRAWQALARDRPGTFRGCLRASVPSARAARRTGRRRSSSRVSSPATGRRWTSAARSPGPAGGSILGCSASTAAPRTDTLELARPPARRDLRRTGRRAVGWSLGGMFARRAGASAPGEGARRVTLCSPFSGDFKTNTNVREFYERIAGHDVNQPPFPATSTASRRCRLSPSGRAGTASSRRAPRAGSTTRSTGRSRSTPIMSAQCCGGRRWASSCTISRHS